MEVRLALRDLEAPVGELDRRLHEVSPRQRAVGAVHGLQAGGGAGNGARLRPDPEELRLRALEDDGDRLRLGPRAARDGDEEVEDAGPAVSRGVDEHEPAATWPGQGTLGHPGSEPGRNAGIDRIAASLQGSSADFGREGVTRGDCALHGLSLRADRRDVGGLLGQHRDDARLAVAGAVLFAASFLLLRLVGVNFELPAAPANPTLSPATVVQPVQPIPALPAPLPVALP